MSETRYTPIFTDADREHRAKLYILVGIPGCGKSTWARRYFRGYQIVSSDEIRKELHPDSQYIEEMNATVFDIFHERIAEMLYKGTPTVADATSLLANARAFLYGIADKHEAEKHVVVFTNTIQALLRNEAREWVVPRHAMERMAMNYIRARDAIMDEDCTSITYIERTT